MTETEATTLPVDVTVCIVNWNGGSDVVDAVGSAWESGAGLSVEVIVVDNASTDGSVAMIREHHPRATIVVNSDNVGFAAANNQAFALGCGRYFLLLNNDARLIGPALRTLVDFGERKPDAGIIGCRVVQPDGIIQLTFGSVPTLRRILFPPRRQREIMGMSFGMDIEARRRVMARVMAERRLGEDQEVAYVSGVCMLVRRAVLDDVGPLDDEFFMYYEDIDWALRAARRGWRTYYVAGALAEHRLAPITTKRRPQQLALAVRLAQIRFLARHQGRPASRVLALAAVSEFLARAAVAALSRRGQDAVAWMQAAAVATRGLRLRHDLPTARLSAT